MLQIQVEDQINVRNVPTIDIDGIKEISQNNKINKFKRMDTNNIEIISRK